MPRLEPRIEAVRTWVEKETANLNSAQCLQLFELAFRKVWEEAHDTISGLTLRAVLGRALFDSSEAFAFLNFLDVQEDGVHWEELRKIEVQIGRDALIGGLRLALTSFISILGNITNDVITGQLCAELGKIRYVPRIKVVKGKTEEEA